MSWGESPSFAHDVGMSLVHSLWQIALVAGLFAVANRLLARGPANLRYVLAYASLLFMLVLPTMTLMAIASQRSTEEHVAAAAVAVAVGGDASAPAAPLPVPWGAPREVVLLPPVETVGGEANDRAAAPLHATRDDAGVGATGEDLSWAFSWSFLLPWLAVAWSCGVIGLSLRPLFALYRCGRMRAQASALAVPWIAEALESLSQQVGLKRKVAIASSSVVQVPTVIGFLRPIVLLPISAVTGQTPDELTAIIAHELAHVRRHDFLLNLLQTAIETLLFYHPAVWWVSTIVREERENCCDDIAMAICGRKNYATALAKLEFARTRNSDLVLAADGGSLYRRIHRIVRPNECTHPLGRFLAAFVALTTLLLGVATVLPTSAIAVTDKGQREANGENEPVTDKGQREANGENEPVTDAKADAIDGKGGDPAGANFQVTIRSESGATYALGDLKHNDVLKESDTARLVADNGPAPQAEVVNAAEDQDSVPTVVDTRIHGRVLDAEGNGVSAKVYVVEKVTGNGTKPGSERILHQADTRSNGQFDFSASLPSRDATIDRRYWNARVLQLVAVADGFGPTASDLVDARKGKPTELRLARDDVPIQGTIRTPEGDPVAGARVRVVILDGRIDVGTLIQSLRKQAQTDEPTGRLSDVFQVQRLFATDFDLDTNERIAANVLQHSQFISKIATTDANGQFRLTGVGRDRMLALELSGPGVVTSWISVISREMEPIDAATFIGAPTRKTYGARFTYVADLAQTIVGRITDAETGKPIKGVLVESTQSGGEMAHVTAVTDADGRYRLEGLPLAERYRVDLIPPPNLPYLARQSVDVRAIARDDNARGPSGRNADELIAHFPLRATKWYTGRIVDKQTGKPVAARISYSPHADNAVAEQYPAFVKGRLATDVFYEDQNSVATNQDGQFRIRVIQGDGMLFVRCDEPNYVTGVGQELIKSDAKWWGYEANRMTNTFQPMAPEWVHRLWPIQVGELADDRVHEIGVDAGRTIAVQMIDPEGKPLTGVRVVHRLPQGSTVGERPTDSDRVSIPAITLNGPRAVFFYHEPRNLAACLFVPHPADAAARAALERTREQQTVQLQPCATVKGRLLDRNGRPIGNVPITICPIRLGDTTKRYVIAQTDQDGRFAAVRVVPNTPLAFHALLSPQAIELGSGKSLQAGEVHDLGERTLDMDLGTSTSPRSP